MKYKFSREEKDYGVVFTARSERVVLDIIDSCAPIRDIQPENFSFLAEDGTRVHLEGGSPEEGDEILRVLSGLK